MSVVPPSPALSFCDTLSSPDLDAYLDSLPALSCLPSPRLEPQDAWWISDAPARISRQDSFFDDEPSTCRTSANALCSITQCQDCESVSALPNMVERFLEKSGVSTNTIAIAYNILASARVSLLHCWHGEGAFAFTTECMWEKMLDIHGPEADGSCQRALIILSALSLAVSFNEDLPRSMSYWSGSVAGNAFSQAQISAMNKIVLAQLDWQIHPLAAPGPVEAAERIILGSSQSKWTQKTPQSFQDEPLRLLVGPNTTIQHGLTTPPGEC